MKHKINQLVVLYELLRVALTVLVVAVQSQQQDWRHYVKHEVLDCSVRVKPTHPIAILLLPLFMQQGIHLGGHVLTDHDLVGGGVDLDGEEEVYPKYNQIQNLALVLLIFRILKGQPKRPLLIPSIFLILRILCVKKAAVSLRHRSPGLLLISVRCNTWCPMLRKQRLLIRVGKELSTILINRASAARSRLRAACFSWHGRRLRCDLGGLALVVLDLSTISQSIQHGRICALAACRLSNL